MHTSPGGALTSVAAIERWDTINDFLRSAIIGESARWGDSLSILGGKFSVTRTRDVDWEEQVTKIRNLLELNTEQFLSELDLLDMCDGFSSRIICFFKSRFWRLVEFINVMDMFYR